MVPVFEHQGFDGDIAHIKGVQKLLRIHLGIAADGGIPVIEGDIRQVVQSGKKIHLAEFAHPGEKNESDILVRPS